MADQSDDKDKWNRRYLSASGDTQGVNSGTISVAQVLEEYAYLLPDSGAALDLACGLGANALFLAGRGFKTHAWDISNVAIDRLKEICQSMSLHIEMQVRDVVAEPPVKNSFEVIIVSRFLDRRLSAPIISALKPGGLLFYQTFIVDKVQGYGPDNPDYLLQQNELLEMFRPLIVRVYREEGLQGNVEKGFRNEAMLVAQKKY